MTPPLDTPVHEEAAPEVLLHPSEMSRGRRWLATLLRSRELSILLVLLAVIAVATIKTPSFLFSGNSWRDLLLTPSILILLAVGQAVVIITRNVDLSVGSVLGLTAYLTGRLFIDHPGLPLIAVILIGVLAGALLGLVNGLLVGFGRVPALGITLGTLSIYRGIVLTWAGSDRINALDRPATSSPSGPSRCSPSLSSSSWRSPCWWPSAITYTPPAAAASCTPSAPTPTPPSSTACGSGAGSRRHSSSVVPSPG